MPTAKNPLRRDYFVYSMAAQGQSFYVGIGRSARASDRVRYVKYLLKREKSGHSVKWVMSNEVIAELVRTGIEVKPKILRPNLNRAQALIAERQVIQWFQQRGILLANRQYNGGFELSCAQVVADVKCRLRQRQMAMQTSHLLLRTGGQQHANSTVSVARRKTTRWAAGSRYRK